MSLEATPSKPDAPAPAVKAERPPPPGAFKLFKPYGYITGYYAALALALMLAVRINPGLIELLPFGGGLGVADNTFEPVNAPAADAAEVLAASVKLAFSIVASFLLMLPVNWI
jgi:hypothetical protein